MAGSVIAALKRLPAPPKNQMYISSAEAHALRMTLDFCDEQCEEGYYNTRHGWAGMTLKKLLDRYDEQTREKRWYIRHKKTGLYLGACHTTGDGIWTDKAHAESWRTKMLALRDGMLYHPFQSLKKSAVNVVLE